MFQTRVKPLCCLVLLVQIFGGARGLVPYALFLFVFPFLMGLTGCGEALSQKTVVRFSTWGSAEELAIIRQLEARFESEHSDIDVQVMHIPENYDQKIHMLAASGLLPDVIAINSWTYPKYACYGLLANLKPFFQSSNQLNEEDFYITALQAFGEGQGDERNGVERSIGAVPRDVSDVVMFVNQSLLKQRGVTLPSRDKRNAWTWQSFMDLAKQVSTGQKAQEKSQPIVFGTSFYRHPPLFWLPWVWMSGGSLWGEDGQLGLNTPQAVQGIQFAHQLLTSGVAPSRQQTGQTTMTQLFVQQRLATMINGRWVVPLLRKQADFDWDVWPLPSGEQGSITGVDASGYALSASSKNKDASWQWISFLSSSFAVRQFVASGLVVPARKDVAESELFLSPKEKPRHSQVFLEVLASGQPTQSHPKLEYFSNVLKVGLEPVWDRETPWNTNQLNRYMDQLVHDAEMGARPLQKRLAKSGEAICPQL